VDLLLLNHHGMNVLPCNQVCCDDLLALNGSLIHAQQLGAHVLSDGVPTLAYLPHCPRELYESFLKANWHRHAWSDGRVVLLGNPLSQYTDK
jgi:hypothetical protein